MYLNVSFDQSLAGGNDRIPKVGTLLITVPSRINDLNRLTILGNQSGFIQQLVLPDFDDLFLCQAVRQPTQLSDVMMTYF